MDRIDALKQEVEKLKASEDRYAKMFELIVEELHYLRYREVKLEVSQR
jgi:hypothetical protein